MCKTAAMLVGLAALPVAVQGQQATVRHLNPPGLPENPAFTEVVVVSGPQKTIYVGGQNAVDAEGNIIGEGDIRAQTAKALQNLDTALRAAGARLENVVKWQVFVVEGASLEEGFSAFEQAWGDRGPPPVLTLAVVRSLWHPSILVEIDAIAVVPDAP